MKKSIRMLTAAVFTVSAAAMLAAPPASAELLGYMGDIDHNLEVNSVDLVLLAKYLLRSGEISPDSIANADMDKDGSVTSFDLVMLRKYMTGELKPESIYTPTDTSEFISAPINDVNYASLPSQGDARLVIFYVDFPDCKYSYTPDAEKIEEIAFGEENTSDVNYPVESMSAFYKRSSKGAMNLDGKAFRYTTKENHSAYDENKTKLLEECYEAFNDSVDFSQFDGDNDGKIDATLFVVPSYAGSENWWPSTSRFNIESDYTVDGRKIGCIITGNAPILNELSCTYFNSTYLHEMGHCMGLPDYYLYNSSDVEGMHGTAGTELMETDVRTDFSAFSKLMLGWYRKDQIQVYDGSENTRTFTLNNAQTDNGNCLIIPYGTLDDEYFSEYFILEYSTAQANNSNPKFVYDIGDGIRIHHIKADLYEDYWLTVKEDSYIYKYWYKEFRYQNGSEYTNGDDDGIRLIRIVNDIEGDNFFRTGDVIDSSVPGFGWYDSDENESIDPGIKISVIDFSDDKYTVTIEKTQPER